MNNATIKINLRELYRPRETLQVCQAATARVKLVNIPSDVSDIGVVVYKTSGEEHYAPVPCNVDDNGDYSCKLLGAMFPTAGLARYEIIGKDEDGDTVALGFGRIMVAEFGSGKETTGEVVSITTIPDEDGVMHKVVAVRNEYGDWTWEIRDLDE